MTKKVEISVIIPNLHSPIVDKTIESVLAQESDVPFEVIVVGMDKYGLVEKFIEVQFINTSVPIGAAEARNIGINSAKGDKLFFIDSDCIASKGWVQSLNYALDQGWPVVGGGIQTPKEPLLLLVYNLSMFHAQLASQKKRKVKFLPTLNLAIKREVVEEVGLLDVELLRGQDMDWTARMLLAGYELLFDPQAKILHQPARHDLKTIRDYFFKSGFFMSKVRLRYPEIFQMTSVLRHAIILRIFAPVIAALTTIRIILKTQEVRQHIRTIPYIYLLKYAWCLGASDRLRSEGNNWHDQ